MRWIVVLAALSCSTAASADFRCRLGEVQCRAVYDGWREYFDGELRDLQLHAKWPEPDRFKYLAKLRTDRHLRIRSRMNPDQGVEFSRLLLCHSKEYRAAAERRPFNDPDCQD